MAIETGTQLILCDLPIRLDSYDGCTHACSYCFVKKKTDISEVEANNSIKQLEDWCNGKRSKNFTWADWKIPLHFGGVSDPFQPIEKNLKITLRMLQTLNKYNYPCVISTKGKLILEEPYFSLIKEGNYVVQVSMISKKYDKVESGASTFEERINMLDKLRGVAKRTIVRCQPYIPAVFSDQFENIKRYQEVGVYGVIFEGMKYAFKAKDTVKHFGDFVIDLKVLEPQFKALKEHCHKHNLKFLCAENRLRSLSDSLSCCGVSGVEGFTPNTYNLNHILFDENKPIPTPGMLQPGSGGTNGFVSLTQKQATAKTMKEKTFVEMMEIVAESSMKKTIG